MAMEIKKTLVLDCGESASKAVSHLVEYPAVIITRGGKYYGIIDHNSAAKPGVRDMSTVKCETLAAKPPVIANEMTVTDRVDAFLLGHFKALPVVDSKERPVGITTRVELLDELRTSGSIPNTSVTELMNSPVYTIGEDETIGKAKNMMKEFNANRLVVIKNGYSIGVVSAFDIASWTTKQNLSYGRLDREREVDLNGLRISEFLRPDVTSIEQDATLDEAVQRMVQKQVSAVIVTSNKKPVGVLSAIDVFKKIQSVLRAPDPIVISGLSEDTLSLYKYMQEKFTHTLSRFGQSFDIRNASVHVKEQKTSFVVSVYLEASDGHISLKEEGKSLREAVDALVVELSQTLRKKKELRRMKPRVQHAD